MHKPVYFSIIEFSYQREVYLMITNDIDMGDEEISLAFTNRVIDEFEYDGPPSWSSDLQKAIDEELDKYAIEIFDYRNPCYYGEDIKLVKRAFVSVITKVNKEHELINQH